MVIFGTGVVTGGFLVRHSERIKTPRLQPRTELVRPQPQLPTPEMVRKIELMGRVQRELNLTPEQRGRIEGYVSESQERARLLWEGVAPLMRKELQETREKIRSELTPEQKKRFEELMKQQQQQHPRRPDDSLSPDRRPRNENFPPSQQPKNSPSPNQPHGL
jgi:hypothetical protein